MKYALFIIQLIPEIIKIVRAVEEVMPEAGKGKEKLEFVREMLTKAYDGVTEAWPNIESVVGVVVKYLNQWGIFKKADV
jgi:hypothetical protein